MSGISGSGRVSTLSVTSSPSSSHRGSAVRGFSTGSRTQRAAVAIETSIVPAIRQQLVVQSVPQVRRSAPPCRTSPSIEWQHGRTIIWCSERLAGQGRLRLRPAPARAAIDGARGFSARWPSEMAASIGVAVGGPIADCGRHLVGYRAAEVGSLVQAPRTETHECPNNAIASMKHP